MGLSDNDCDDVDAAVLDGDSVDPQVGFEGFSRVVEVVDADVPAGVEETHPSTHGSVRSRCGQLRHEGHNAGH